MRHRLIALPVSFAVAAGLVACGSEALSKDEYIKQADAICKKVNDEGKKLPEPKKIADFGVLADKARPLLEGEIEQLRDLKAPDEIKDRADDAYDLLDQQAANLGKLKDVAKTNDEKQLEEIATSTGKLSTQASAKAKEIGLKVCGSGG